MSLVTATLTLPHQLVISHMTSPSHCDRQSLVFCILSKRREEHPLQFPQGHATLPFTLTSSCYNNVRQVRASQRVTCVWRPGRLRQMFRSHTSGVARHVTQFHGLAAAAWSECKPHSLQPICMHSGLRTTSGWVRVSDRATPMLHTIFTCTCGIHWPKPKATRRSVRTVSGCPRLVAAPAWRLQSSQYSAPPVSQMCGDTFPAKASNPAVLHLGTKSQHISQNDSAPISSLFPGFTEPQYMLTKIWGTPPTFSTMQ